MWQPNTDSASNKLVTWPRNQLLIRYAVTSPVHTLMTRCYVTRLRYKCGTTIIVTVCLHFVNCLASEKLPLRYSYYLLTPWCRVLLEQLTGLQLVKKFPAFHGTRRFITAPTSVRHLSLSWASPIQSIYPHPTSWRSILILSTHLRLGLPSGPFPSGFPTKTLLLII